MSYLLRSLLLTVGFFMPLLAWAYPASYYTPLSALADGLWVKVEIDESGIYEISYDQLRQWGFSDPAKVNVFGYGGMMANEHNFPSDMPDDMPLAPSLHSSDGRLIFYADGAFRATVDRPTTANPQRLRFARNPYTDAVAYFLSDVKTAPQPLTPVPFKAETEGRAIRNWSYAYDRAENDVQNVCEAGYMYHDRKMAAGDAVEYELSIRDFGWNNSTEPRAYVRYDAYINSPNRHNLAVAVEGDVTVDAKRNDATPSNATPTRNYVEAAPNSYISLKETADRPLQDVSFKLSIGLPASFDGSYMAVDRAYVFYPRVNRMHSDESELMMMMAKRDFISQNFTIDNTGDDLVIWNVTKPLNVLSYEYVYSPETRTATACYGAQYRDSQQRLVAFNISSPHRKPRYAGTVPNQNLHGHDTPDILVVSTASLLDGAQELADIHRAQGLDVVVATQDEIFNEFAVGTRTPAAVHRMAKMFYDREPGRLRHIVLYGNCTWDIRFIQHEPSDALISLVAENYEQARDVAASYVCDLYFGMLADDYDHSYIWKMPAQVSVGRMPVTSPAVAAIVNDKVRRYLASPPPVASALRIIKYSDDGDNGQHFANSELVGEALLENPLYTVFRGDVLFYPHHQARFPGAEKIIDNTLTRGAGFFHYTGHSTSSATTAENVWSSNRSKNLEFDYPTFGIFSSCDTYPLDREANSMVQLMVSQPRGGMIGMIGACRSVYLEHNQSLSMGISHLYAHAEPGMTGADILRVARNNMIADPTTFSAGLGYNTLCYNYCGDPAVPLSLPTFGIDFEYPAGASAPVAGKSHKLAGKVTDDEGNTVTYFNGQALVEIFDAPTDRTTILRESNDGNEPTTVSCDENLLAEFPVRVVDGIIDADIVMPQPQIEGKPFRIVVSALDDASRVGAAGVIRGNSVTVDDTPASQMPPRIIDFAISPDSYIGEYTRANIVVTATIDPSESGLSVATGGIRSNIVLVLDGKTRFLQTRNLLRYADDGTATFSIPVNGLSFGRHTLELSVANNAGLADARAITFIAGTESLSAVMTVEGETAARSEVVLDIDRHDTGAMLMITDADGNTVFSRNDVAFPFSWDLRGNNGTAVPDGHYRAWAILDNDVARGASNKVEFVVIK